MGDAWRAPKMGRGAVWGEVSSPQPTMRGVWGNVVSCPSGIRSRVLAETDLGIF